MNRWPHLRFDSAIPSEYRANFFHLYLDVAWYGVLNASALTFLSVFAARQGGTPFQVGLLTAGPAAMNLLVAMPIGHWLKRQPIGKAVFWTSIAHRVFYLLWVPLPMLLPPLLQVWVLIGLTIMMSVPGAALAIGFNALFAEAVPPPWRGHVAGVRNALLAIASIASALVCGYILTTTPFPLGYQVVFSIGAVAALLSSFHLWFVRPLEERPSPSLMEGSAGWGSQHAQSDQRTLPHLGAWVKGVLRTFVSDLLRIEILREPFAKVLIALLIFHITQFVAVPVVPVFMVRVLHLQDQQIGLATAVFWLSVFVSSTQLARLCQVRGHQAATGIGAMLMAFYPGLMVFGVPLGMAAVLAASCLGGIGYAWMSGAFLNYILERAPQHDRPPYLAWYNIVFNAAILIGSLLGPSTATSLGFVPALALFAVARVAAGLFIIKGG
ncbi:MAG: MFS transporter [Anaerolineae bacterium]|nr:MFS transporter [Anaerolineae bacterium]MDW8071564.1 MFS transporter [Anaerolineae bacterium]